MPRQIDLQCPKCGFIEEVQKEMVFFEDEESMENVCPKCHYPYRKELPPLINLYKRPFDMFPKPPKKLPKLSPEGVLPEDVRRAFAKELFDPCSCGQHAPADLFEHDSDCHTQQHSFMKEEEAEEK